VCVCVCVCIYIYIYIYISQSLLFNYFLNVSVLNDHLQGNSQLQTLSIAEVCNIDEIYS